MVFFLVVVFGGIASFFGPWWSVAPICFLLHFWLSASSRSAFWSSAVAVVFLWFCYAFYIDLFASADLNERIAGIVTAGASALEGIPGIVITYFIMILIALVVGGFSGMAGVQVRKFIRTGRN